MLKYEQRAEGVTPAASRDSASTLSLESPDDCSLKGLLADRVSQLEDHLLGLLSEAGLGPVLIAHGNGKLLATRHSFSQQ